MAAVDIFCWFEKQFGGHQVGERDGCQCDTIRDQAHWFWSGSPWNATSLIWEGAVDTEFRARQSCMISGQSICGAWSSAQRRCPFVSLASTRYRNQNKCVQESQHTLRLSTSNFWNWDICQICWEGWDYCGRYADVSLIVSTANPKVPQSALFSCRILIMGFIEVLFPLVGWFLEGFSTLTSPRKKRATWLFDGRFFFGCHKIS